MHALDRLPPGADAAIRSFDAKQWQRVRLLFAERLQVGGVAPRAGWYFGKPRDGAVAYGGCMELSINVVCGKHPLSDDNACPTCCEQVQGALVLWAVASTIFETVQRRNAQNTN